MNIKLSDLKPGMWVTLAEGYVCLIKSCTTETYTTKTTYANSFDVEEHSEVSYVFDVMRKLGEEALTLCVDAEDAYLVIEQSEKQRKTMVLNPNALYQIE